MHVVSIRESKESGDMYLIKAASQEVEIKTLPAITNM
jgi:hypothetical protein